MSKVRDNGWAILNGRCKGDPRGEYTYEARGAKSTVDYVVVRGKAEADMKVMREGSVVADGHNLILVEVIARRKGEPTAVERDWA